MVLTIHTDGGSRGNPGIAGIGIVIKEGNYVVGEIAESIGMQTNNFAEYTAVIRALEWLIEKKLTHEPVHFKLDSLLVVQQINGAWKVKEPTLKPLVARVHTLLESFTEVTFLHIPRELNFEADTLANRAMDQG